MTKKVKETKQPKKESKKQYIFKRAFKSGETLYRQNQMVVLTDCEAYKLKDFLV